MLHTTRDIKISRRQVLSKALGVSVLASLPFNIGQGFLTPSSPRKQSEAGFSKPHSRPIRRALIRFEVQAACRMW